MSFTATLYLNSGFNTVNIPNGPGLIQNVCTKVTTSTLNIVQNQNLQGVIIPANAATVQNADYLNLGGFWYSVKNVKAVSPEACLLEIVPDYITSAGGPGALEILDGLTVRHHVTDDSFGAYTEDDPYLVPSKPLEIDAAGWLGGDNGSDTTFCTTTLDLAAMGADDYTQTGITFTDSTSNETCTIPNVTYNTGSTGFYMGGSNTRHAFLTGIALYKVNSTIIKGMNYARTIGVETAITAQYAIPSSYFTLGTSTTDAVESIRGATGTIDSGLAFQYATVNNLRVLYGNLNQFHIITAAGNSADFNPEDIYSGDTASFQYAIDPQPEGKPYFAPASYKGNSNIWANNPITGSDWRQVPLIFTQKAGSVQDAYNFASDRKLASSQYEQANINRWFDFGTRTLDRYQQATQSASVLSAPGTAAGVALATANTAIDATRTASDQLFATEQYNLSRDKELYNMGVSQNITVPTIMFPYQSAGIRDYVGNNLFVYRTRLAPSDVTKLDKILTMYGYKDTAPLTTSMFSSRSDFNYVQTQGVSIGGNLPGWWKDGIASQLNAGTRIWHVAPSVTYYG